MTRREYDFWQEETQRSKSQWRMDEISLHNNNEYLFYKGGEHGFFIMIDVTGKIEIGNYIGAYPHIGEAVFNIRGTKTLPTQDEAVRRVVSHLGIQFLIDVIH